MYNRVLKNYRIVDTVPGHSATPGSAGAGPKADKGVENLIRKLKDIENINLDINKNQVHTDLVLQSKQILDDARKEADRIIEEAMNEASRMLEAAKKECEEIKKAARELGEKEGYVEGLERAISECKAMTEEAKQLRDKAREEFEKTVASIESEIVKLVIDIAKKVLDRELAQDRGSILDLIRQAVSKCNISGGALLRLSEQDYEFVQLNLSQFHKAVEDSNKIEIMKDPVLSPGSCILETSYGFIDAGIDTQLEKIRELFSRQLGCELSLETRAASR